MVQWFKNLFKKKKPAYVPLIEFNVGVHHNFIVSSGAKLFNCRNEEGFQLLRRIIESNRNLELCSLASLRAGDTLTLAKVQGRLEALTLLGNYCQDAVDPEIYKARLKDNEEKKKDTARILRMSRGVSADAVI